MLGYDVFATRSEQAREDLIVATFELGGPVTFALRRLLLNPTTATLLQCHAWRTVWKVCAQTTA